MIAHLRSSKQTTNLNNKNYCHNCVGKWWYLKHSGSRSLTTVLEDWNQSRTSCCLESFDNNNCVISKLCMLSLRNILLNSCVTQKPNTSFLPKNTDTFWKIDLAEKWTNHPAGNSKFKILLHSKLEQHLKPQKVMRMGTFWFENTLVQPGLSIYQHNSWEKGPSQLTAGGRMETWIQTHKGKPSLELGGHAGQLSDLGTPESLQPQGA